MPRLVVQRLEQSLELGHTYARIPGTSTGIKVNGHAGKRRDGSLDTDQHRPLAGEPLVDLLASFK